jgi:hypothetical protein
MRKDAPALQKKEGCADQGYQDDVGIVFVLERELDQRSRMPRRQPASNRDKGSEADASYPTDPTWNHPVNRDQLAPTPALSRTRAWFRSLGPHAMVQTSILLLLRGLKQNAIPESCH